MSENLMGRTDEVPPAASSIQPMNDPYLLGRCADAGHTERCNAWCGSHTGTGCSIGRKHFSVGGVCCVTCYDLCSDCGAAFYTEDLHFLGETVDEDGDEVARMVCHCCKLRADVGRLSAGGES